MRKLTFYKIFEILEIDYPEKFENIKYKEISKIVHSVRLITPNCALFIGDSYIHDNPDSEIAQCINRGAEIIFMAQNTYDRISIEGPFIVVDNVRENVVKLSSHIRAQFQNTVIGITGSLGKTTSKDLIYEALNISHNTIKSLGNENTLSPLIKNVQKLDKEVEYYVQEYGIGSPKTILDTIEACVPDVAIITNIYDSHIGAYGSREKILEEKIELIKKMPKGNTAFLNYDDILLKSLSLDDYNIITYGIDSKDVDYYADNIVELNGHIDFDIIHSERKSHITIYLRGKHNVYNALVAFAVADYFNVPEEEIAEGISSYKAKGMRQFHTNIGGYEMFVDTYNAAPQSLLSSMHVLEDLEPKNSGRRIAVVCEIMKLGEHEERINRELGEQFKDLKIDVIYSFGNDNAKLLILEAEKNGIEVHHTSEREVLNKWLKENVTTDDVMMFKGIRHLERTIDQVYGSNYFLSGEFYSYITKGDFEYKIIYEYYDFSLKTAAVYHYLGEEKAVTIPDNIDGIPITYISTGCFKGNITVEDITIPNTVTCISRGAFRNCTKLQSIDFSDSLLSIKENAFRNCTSLKETVLPYGLLQIDDNAFMNCKSLEILSMPESVNLYGDNIFKNVPKFKLKCLGKNDEDYFTFNGYRLVLNRGYKPSLKVIGFDKCTSQVEIPQSYKSLNITSISKKAFYGNDKIKEVYIPEGIKTIGNYAFSRCRNLKYVSLPTTLNKLYDNSFGSSYKIKFNSNKNAYAIQMLKLNSFNYKLHRLKCILLSK